MIVVKITIFMVVITILSFVLLYMCLNVYPELKQKKFMTWWAGLTGLMVPVDVIAIVISLFWFLFFR